AGDGVDREREQQAAADVAVAGHVELRGGQNHRRGAFQGLGGAIVTVGVLEKEAVAAANGQLTIASRIPGEADARSRVKEMAFHAAGVGRGADRGARKSGNGKRAALAAALNDAVERIASTADERAR